MATEKELNIRGKTSFVYKMIEHLGRQGVTFLISIILARLLLPSDYGVIAIMSIFITFAEVLVHSGFNKALIQKKHVTDEDYSSVFFVSLCFAIILYVLLYFTAPEIEHFFGFTNFVIPFRIMAISIFLDVYNSVQNAKAQRDLMFKQLMIYNNIAAIISGIAGITLAYLNMGIWALVGQYVFMQFLTCIFVRRFINWHPVRVHNYNGIRPLLSFGWKILLTDIISVLYDNIRGIVIGKKYTNSDLGFYNKGKNFPVQINNFVYNTVCVVLLPLLSKEQDNREVLVDMGRKIKRISLQVSLPAFIGMYMIAPELITLLLTDVWSNSVPFVRIACLMYAINQIYIINLQMIFAIGNSTVTLFTEVISKIAGIILLIFAVMYFNTSYYIAISEFLAMLPVVLINAYYVKKLIGYKIREQLMDLIIPLFLTIIVVFSCIIIEMFSFNTIYMFFFKLIVSILLYSIMVFLLKTELYLMVTNIFFKRKV